MYRLLFAILLIAQTLGFATVTTAASVTSDPIPACLPCPDGVR